MAAPAYRNHTIGGYSTAANITASEPSGAAQNDILCADLYIESDTTVTLPSGWTATFASTTMMQEANFSGQAFRHYKYWIRRGASAPDLTWVFSSSFRAILVTAYSGALTSGDPFSFVDQDVRDSDANRTIPDCSGTTSDADELLVWTAMTWTSPTSSTQPTGYTERLDMNGGNDVALADLVQASPGGVSSTGAEWAGGAVAPATVMLVGLRPAAAGGGGPTAAEQAGIFESQRVGATIIGRVDA